MPGRRTTFSATAVRATQEGLRTGISGVRLLRLAAMTMSGRTAIARVRPKRTVVGPVARKGRGVRAPISRLRIVGRARIWKLCGRTIRKCSR
jgi:hypothetical protein